MYGWRARLGVMVIPVDFIQVPELYDMAPKGVAIYSNMLRKKTQKSMKPSEENLAISTPEVVNECLEGLLKVNPDVICFGCTSGSFAGGPRYDQRIVQIIEKKAQGIPATTATTAILNGLRELDVARVAVGTPYPDELNDKLKEVLGEAGFEVVKIQTMQLCSIVPPEEIYDLITIREIYRLGKKVDTSKAEAVCLVCAGLATAPVIEKLESDLKKPVVTTNQASLWDMLKKAKVAGPIDHFGTLLKTL